MLVLGGDQGCPLHPRESITLNEFPIPVTTNRVCPALGQATKKPGQNRVFFGLPTGNGPTIKSFLLSSAKRNRGAGAKPVLLDGHSFLVIALENYLLGL